MPYVIPSGSIQATAAQQGTAPTPPAIPQLPAEPGGATPVGGAGSQPRTEILIPPFRENSPIPPEVIPIVGIVFSMLAAMVIGSPLARAIARVIERRGQSGALSAKDVAPQLRQLQESVDAMSIELERIGEAQRFTAKLMADRATALGAGERPPV